MYTSTLSVSSGSGLPDSSTAFSSRESQFPSPVSILSHHTCRVLFSPQHAPPLSFSNESVRVRLFTYYLHCLFLLLSLRWAPPHLFREVTALSHCMYVLAGRQLVGAARVAAADVADVRPLGKLVDVGGRPEVDVAVPERRLVWDRAFAPDQHRWMCRWCSQ